MSDAPRPEPAPDDRPEDEGPTPGTTPTDAPTAEAWPGTDEEAGAMPAEQGPDEGGQPAGDSEADPEADAEAERLEAERAEAERQEAERVAAAEDPRSRQELFAALKGAEAQRDEYLDDVRRGRAEFENFRRRTMREGATQRDAGRAEVLEGLLDVLDDVDRTLEAASASSDETLAKGVQLVAEKLVGSLKAAGLERVDATGVAFDPNHHEAVQQTESDQERDEPVVSQVLRPGYRLGDRVLRAAMVVVEQ